MTLLDEVLQANQAYLEHTQEVNTWSKYPQKHLAIVSCMDTRLVELLEPALGIRRGEVKMIKTAGNSSSKAQALYSSDLSSALFLRAKNPPREPCGQSPHCSRDTERPLSLLQAERLRT